MRFNYNKAKSSRLKKARGVSFDEVQKLWSVPYSLDQRTEVPEQWRAIGWIRGRLYAAILKNVLTPSATTCSL
jgi:uncharacterized DUF497 family protein